MREADDRLQAKKLNWDVAGLHSERNTILGRIRRRRSGEPTATELARLESIRQQLADLATEP